MDFDDLDDAIEEKLASGDTEGLENMTFVKKDLKKFEGTLPVIQPSKSLVTCDFGPKEIKLRVFIFYGPGDSAQNFQEIANQFNMYVGHIQPAVHEWPGHGGRSDEAMADNVDALVADALEAIMPCIEQVKEGAEFEGAPFAFVGSSVGCQVMTALAKKLLMNYGLGPSAAVVMNRAALQFPLLSTAGQTVLDSSPEKVVQAFKVMSYPRLEKGDIEKIAKGYQYTNETRDPMYHKYDCDMMVVKSSSDLAIDAIGKKGGDYKLTTLKIKGSNELFTLPVTSKTKVQEFLTVVGNIFANSKQTELSVFNEDGTAIDKFDAVKNVMTIDGVEDFKHPRYTWPHPIAVIGAGFFGVKLAMQYHYHKNHNVVVFDRLKEAGGYAWHLSATKHSRVQTDFGAFNIWFGHEYNYSGDGDGGFGAEKGGRKQFNSPFKGPGSPMGGTVASGAGTTMDANPVRHQVIGQLNYALKEYDAVTCARFETEVSSLRIIGDPEAEGRCYKLGLHDLRDTPEIGEVGTGTKENNAWQHELGRGTAIDEDFKASVIYHFPGAYDLNRIVNYPGEDKFGGQIGYGMGSGHGGLFIFDKDMKGKRAAVLGNGAFSVENVRSCIEGYASKIYIVTRRKSLLCPRMPCWFCHQGPVPTPAPLLLDIFKPMYDCAGIESPWDFYCVTNVNAKRTTCCLKQSSRFGIGDVTFLAHAVGLFEYRVGVVERFSPKTIHLSTGEKLENMDHVCKALGLIGDPRVDQLHAMTHRIGNFVNGDWRRIISADATGMDAMRFTTFSAGPGACSMAKQWYYMHNHPWEYRVAIADPTYAMMPKHQLSSTQPDQTVYMTNVQYEMHSGNILFNCWPSMGRCMGDEATYKWCLVQTMHPTKEYFDYCKADWDRYQKLIKENCPGFEDMKDVPYPYTAEVVSEWCDRYNKDCKYFMPITPAGPPEDVKKQTIDQFKMGEKYWKDSDIPELIKEYKLVPDLDASQNPMQVAEACEIYRLRKDLTATAPDSAMDFDEAQYEAWKHCISSESAFVVEHADCAGDSIITNGQAWGPVLGFLAGKA